MVSGANASDTYGRPADRRKLVAVLYADMVGYSRLIGFDDQGTLDRLRALRREVIDPAIEEHGGKIVQTGGDSLLVVFDSIDGAVRCGIKVQQELPGHDADQPDDRAIRFRIGINLGDAIADGTDLHGDAVNVAARIQAECPPGDICVSRSVRDHVHGRLKLTFEELGTLSLKNIARPVEAFAVRVDVANVPKSVERSLVDNTREPLPLPGKPSIAVLAFTNMSGDPEQEYFSDGIADDIITELSRSRSLFVIARNFSFAYRERSVDVRQIARELGVRYVLEGSVRRSAGRVRVTAQLIEAESGNHIWAERYDRDIREVFAVQYEIAAAVASAILPAVSDLEQQRALRRPPDSLDAWEAYQRGLWHLGRVSAADTEQAKEYLRRATSLDATFANPHTALAMVCMREGVVFATCSLHEASRLASGWARKAVTIDANDAEANATLALTRVMDGILEESWEGTSLALQINPNSSWAHSVKGVLLTYSGQPFQGREELLNALRLSPRDPLNVVPVTIIPVSYYFESDYPSALAAARRAASRFPDAPIAHRYVAASLGQLGRTDDAREALRRAMVVSDEGFDFYVRSRPPWFRPEDHQHMLDGLRKAGWEG